MPGPRTYWLDLFTPATWQCFLEGGAQVCGFRERRWKTVRKIRPGDHLLCYLTGRSRWIGLLEVVSFPYLEQAPWWEEVVSAPYFAREPLWETDEFPAKVKVKPVVTLTPETAIPIVSLRDELSLFQDLAHPHAWIGQVRSSPGEWQSRDGEVVVRALTAAKDTPTALDVDPKRLGPKPVALPSRRGTLTVAEAAGITETEDDDSTGRQEATAHTEMQWLLLKLGNDMGFAVWAARNDKGRDYQGRPFSSLPRMRDSLPLPFEEATNRIIELIDVLWLKGNAIVAAFEIENTTTVYSGLLRRADLIALQPNLTIPLYLVAPDERCHKAIAEVNRPTFSRLSPPLSELCRLITFSALRDRLSQISPFLRYLKPDFLEELSESCATDDA